MNVKELIQIIKDEELYKYGLFEIGTPHAIDNIGTFNNGSESYGICKASDGAWREYMISDRGGITFTPGAQHPPKDFTEDGACRALLETLRIEKAVALQDKRKPHYTVRNADKWFTTKN